MTDSHPLFTLHIGVGTYADDTIEDLKGAANDARWWERYAIGGPYLALDADQVTVLIDAQATRKGILDAIEALGQAMLERQATGLITFSGHGTALPGTGDAGQGIGATGAICPHDTDPSSPDSVISLAELEQALGEAMSKATVVLDCCYDASAITSAGPPRAIHPPGGGDTSVDLDFKDARALLAAQPWEVALEFLTNGIWHGAFTWSLLTALEQWTVAREPVVYAKVAHNDLLFATTTLLRTLGVPQHPTLIAKPRIGMVPFLRPGDALAEGRTSPEPDRTREGEQLGFGEGDGFQEYRIQARWNGDTAWVNLAKVHVPNAGNKDPGWTKDTEYWFPVQVENTGPPDQTRVKLKSGNVNLAGIGHPDPGNAAFTRSCVAAFAQSGPPAPDWILRTIDGGAPDTPVAMGFDVQTSDNGSTITRVYFAANVENPGQLLTCAPAPSSVAFVEPYPSPQDGWYLNEGS